MKIERKYLAHYLNVTPAENATYERLGKDLEELNVSLNPNVATTNNILGETSVNITSYQPQASVTPYYADKENALSTYLLDLIDNRKLGDDLKTDIIEVHLWTGEGTSFTAFKDECFIEVGEYGGNTDGVQIPFNVHYTNKRVKGTFNVTTKTFTEE